MRAACTVTTDDKRRVNNVSVTLLQPYYRTRQTKVKVSLACASNYCSFMSLCMTVYHSRKHNAILSGKRCLTLNLLSSRIYCLGTDKTHNTIYASESSIYSL